MEPWYYKTGYTHREKYTLFLPKKDQGLPLTRYLDRGNHEGQATGSRQNRECQARLRYPPCNTKLAAFLMPAKNYQPNVPTGARADSLEKSQNSWVLTHPCTSPSPYNWDRHTIGQFHDLP